MTFTEPVVEHLTSALTGGTTSAADAARRCVAARLSAEMVASALLEAERTMAASVVDGRASAASTAMAGRLRAAVDALAPLWEAAYAESAAAGEPAGTPGGTPTGTLAVASMPGDAHDVGRHLWRARLTSWG